MVKTKKENPFPYWDMGMEIGLGFGFIYSAVSLMYGDSTWPWVIFNIVFMIVAASGMFYYFKNIMAWANREDARLLRLKEEREKNVLGQFERWDN